MLTLLTDEIMKGRRLTRQDNLKQFLDIDLEELCHGADRLRRFFCKDHADLCTIINGRSGRCTEDCKFCAQSAYHQTDVETYTFLPEEEIVADCRRNQAQGVHRYSIVTSGRALAGEDLDKAEKIYKRLNSSCDIYLCASHGLLDQEALGRLKASGVKRYHENIETSRRYFPNICSTHTYEEKIATIRAAKAVGLEICCGGIIGMGETWEDRLDMAVSIAELEVSSVPINILQPIPGTPYAEQTALDESEVLRTIAIFRYLNPAADIRLAGGRKQLKESGKNAFRCGANAAITGDLLTTSGNTIQADKEMLAELKFTL